VSKSQMDFDSQLADLTESHLSLSGQDNDSPPRSARRIRLEWSSSESSELTGLSKEDIDLVAVVASELDRDSALEGPGTTPNERWHMTPTQLEFEKQAELAIADAYDQEDTVRAETPKNATADNLDADKKEHSPFCYNELRDFLGAAPKMNFDIDLVDDDLNYEGTMIGAPDLGLMTHDEPETPKPPPAAIPEVTEPNALAEASEAAGEVETPEKSFVRRRLRGKQIAPPEYEALMDERYEQIMVLKADHLMIELKQAMEELCEQELKLINSFAKPAETRRLTRVSVRSFISVATGSNHRK
jgi:hypothetical protein